MAEQVSFEQRRQKATAKGVLIGILTVLFVIFCFMNLGSAHIWPIGNAPLIVVILISFILGALIGWLVKSLSGSKSTQRGS